MPCSDGGYSRGDIDVRDNRRELDALRAKIADMEAMLCSACTALEANGFNFALNPMLDRWFYSHKEKDAARIAKEQAEKAKRAIEQATIKDAMNKPISQLTDEEKAILRKHKII